MLNGHPQKDRTSIFKTNYHLYNNAGQKYCRMLQGEHSAILSTFIKLPFAIKTFVLSIFEWLLYTGLTVINQNETEASSFSENKHKCLSIRVVLFI